MHSRNLSARFNYKAICVLLTWTLELSTRPKAKAMRQLLRSSMLLSSILPSLMPTTA